MKNNSIGMKLLMAVVTLAVLTYFGIQAYLYFDDPLTTTVAYTYQVEEGVELTGYVVRDEQVLEEEPSGLVRIQRDEGERVSTGGVIARVYANQEAMDQQAQIESLVTQIEQLQYAQEAALGAEAALKLDAQILSNLLAYRGYVAEDRLDMAEKKGSELRGLVLKRDYTYSDATDLSGEIAELEAQLKDLRSKAAGSVRTITASRTGLYSAVVDGYESVLTPESLAELTPSKLSAVRADSSVQSDMGKLILGDTWYYAATMSKSDAETLQKKQAQGIGLTLQFSKSIERSLSVRLESVSEEENGRVVAVFKGRTYLAELTLLRQQGAKIIYKSESGIRIPKEALRAEKVTVNAEGERTTEQTMGAYCVVGMEARFKPVEVLYNGENFVLVRSTAGEDQEKLRLRHGDEVIITANDLYDGKVLG